MGIGIGVIFILFCISLPFLLFVIFAIRKIIVCWKILYIDFSSQFSSWFSLIQICGSCVLPSAFPLPAALCSLCTAAAALAQLSESTADVEPYLCGLSLIRLHFHKSIFQFSLNLFTVTLEVYCPKR